MHYVILGFLLLQTVFLVGAVTLVLSRLDALEELLNGRTPSPGQDLRILQNLCAQQAAELERLYDHTPTKEGTPCTLSS